VTKTKTKTIGRDKTNTDRQRRYMENLRSRAEATDEKVREIAEERIKELAEGLAREQAENEAHEHTDPIAKEAAERGL
jgi:hypothetical protein